jgi:hypothetical protein
MDKNFSTLLFFLHMTFVLGPSNVLDFDMRWDELSCILATFRIIVRWLYVAKLELVLPSKPPVLLGILMQPVHSLWPFSSLKDASRYWVEFWKKVLRRRLWTRKSIIRLMCRKRATLSVLDVRLAYQLILFLSTTVLNFIEIE